MKRIITGSLWAMLCFSAGAQTKQHDSLAILIIDRMTDVIGDLESCSFTLHTGKDIIDTQALVVKQFTQYQVYMSGNDKMLVNAHGDRGHLEFWYNGQQLAHYNQAENNYGILQVPDKTIDMIDSVSKLYQVEFPAADFFYPTFTDDLLAHADLLKFLGMVYINGHDCFHILASNKEMTMQFWISNDAYNLPVRFAITYTSKEGNPQYEAAFSNWQINPNLPLTMFDFQPPPGSAKVRIMAANER